MRATVASRLRRLDAVAILIAVMWAVAALLHAGLFLSGGPHDSLFPLGWPTWLVLAAVFALSEIFVVHMPTARNAHTYTFADVPVVLALAFASPSEYLLAALLGSGAALIAHQRLRGAKVAFNLGMYALQAAVAVIVYRVTIGDAQPDDPRGWVAAALALTAISLLGALLVVGVIRLSGDGLDGSMLADLPSGLMATWGNTAIALVLVVLVVHQPLALPLLLVVLIILLSAYRSYADLAKRHKQTRALYQFVASTSVVSGERDDGLGNVLREARDLLGAGTARLLLPAGGGGVQLSVDEDGVVQQQSLPAESLTQWSQQVQAGTALTEQGELAAAVSLAGGGSAVLVVGGRLFDADPFTPADLGLMSALAGHAGGVLQRADLVRRLRAQVVAREYEARHDPLTKLPNRRDLDRHFPLDAGTGAGAVLLLGLDHFRQVNDTLGHRVGDDVLVEVGRRLLGCDVGPVARLGGDEFVILVAGQAGADGAEAVAGRLLQSVTAPMVVDGVDVVVGATVGIARAPDHGVDIDVLLAHADLAMAVAKGSGMPFATYQLTDEGVRRRRLQMAVDLGPALTAGQISPWFQPQVDAATGELVSVEALVRWNHPTLGLVMPDDILPVSVSTGLQRRLTDQVLTAALRSRASWSGPWRGARVAVNVTARDLIDEQLPSVVEAALTRNGVTPDALTIEVTEEAFITDIQRTVEILDALSALGVRLSIDDFGTGYSSLSYLQRLPVQEVKIDKSFVWRLEDTADTTVIKAVVDLGHALGMSVVVEGVEHERTWQVLRELGVDIGQGWLFGRPRPGEVDQYDSAVGLVPRQAAFGAAPLVTGRSEG